MERYNEFSKWINTHLCNDLPDNVVAINFNLYEGPNYEKVGETYHERIGEDAYHVEIVGCDRFDEHDED